MEVFHHEPLSNSTQDIRLLFVHPGAKHDPLAITISTFDRASAPPYAALSYVWGDDHLTKRILANGKLLYVTESCWYALGQLRLRKSQELYWIDFICISQTDVAEKSAQVNMMGVSYRECECVMVSCGKHDKESKLLFEKLSPYSASPHQTSEQHLKKLKPLAQSLNAVWDECLIHAVLIFANRSYWTRLWTTQEFALPGKAILMCGSEPLDWDHMFGFTMALGELLRDIQGAHRGPWITTESALNNLPMIRTGNLRHEIQLSLKRKSRSLTDVFLKLGDRKCTDPRDKIFGLLSLVEWTGNLNPILADYSLSAAHLTLQVTLHSRGALTCSLISQMELRPDNTILLEMADQRSRDSTTAIHEGVQESSRAVVLHGHHGWYEITGKESVLSGTRAWKIIECPSQRDASGLCVSLRHKLQVPVSAQRKDIVLSAYPRNVRPFMSRDAGIGQDFYHTFQRAALVLRPFGGRMFNIIGHAVLKSESIISLKRLSSFSLHLDAEDFLLWAWLAHHGQRPARLGCTRDPSVLSVQFCRTALSSYAIHDDEVAENHTSLAIYSA